MNWQMAYLAHSKGRLFYIMLLLCHKNAPVQCSFFLTEMLGLSPPTPKKSLKCSVNAHTA